MSNSTNILTGLNISAQIPLNTKKFIQNEATLAYLVVGNNLAFTYYEWLRVTTFDEGTTWEWREVEVGQENTGLVTLDFTYPSNLVVNGVTYSNRKFNFFQVITEGTVGPQGPPGAASTVPGPTGPQGPPGLNASNNNQKTITGNYVISNTDNNYVIIIDNGLTPITVTIPAGLLTKLNVGFFQLGSANVTFTTSGTTINTPVGYKIKGQYGWALILHIANAGTGLGTNIYQLAGTLKV